MNPAQSQPNPTLHIVPKLSRSTFPVRQLVAHHGIMWAMVGSIFDRYGWDILQQTDLFLTAYHPQTDITLHVSKMGQGTVLVNKHYQTSVISELHELETIADIHQPLI